MHWRRWRLKTALFLALVVLIYWFIPAELRSGLDETVLADPFDELLPDELQEGRYYRMVDEEGRTIVITGRRLRAGDRYLNEGNKLYEVTGVDGYLARARFMEQVKHRPDRDAAPGAGPVSPAQAQRTAYKIAIYHSHNAESYVPSDGTDSIYGRGGIHDVGDAFREALEQKGITVLYSERFHLPHDRGAYRRSRATAQELLGQGPDAIFDVHRDAAPWEAYALEWDGDYITQIQFVVGLSHPGAAANRNFAFDLKGYADRIHPGLVRGVFLLFGNYNQDLSPMNLLLEVGAHTNTKDAAERGITLFADVVGYYFYGPATLENGGRDAARDRADDDPLPPALFRDAGGISGAISGTVISLLLASLGAALGFYFLNNPVSLENIIVWWERLPERAVAAAGRLRQYAREFPALARRKWFEAPENLRRAWRGLQDESKVFPGWAQSRLSAAALGILATTRGWWRELPLNWRRSRAILVQESRAFPGVSRRWFYNLGAAAARALQWSRQTAAYAWRRVRESLVPAWSRLKAEAAYWASLAREKLEKLRQLLNRTRLR